MAKGKKTGGKNFAKGKSGNPAGGPRLSEEAKALRKLTKSEFIERVTKYLYIPQTQLSEIIDDQRTDALDAWICKSIKTGIEDGDYDKLDQMMNRLIGKPKEEEAEDFNEKLSALVEAMTNAAQAAQRQPES